MFLLYLAIAASATAPDIRPLLRNQGFVGPINGRETVRYVGQIREGKNRFQIYTYRGVFQAAAVDHGVNRLIIVKNERMVLGTYAADAPLDCKVVANRASCTAGSITFSTRGPALESYFDGRPQRMDLATNW